jgi:RNA polymerase sigma-70 factor, ECF subfamily
MFRRIKMTAAMKDTPLNSAHPQAAGVGTAQDLFVEEHLRRIYIQIYRMVGNAHDAQDLTQETFIKALQRKDQCREGDKAAHWLSRIATNTAIDFLRRQNRAVPVSMDAMPMPLPDSKFQSPEQAVLAGERMTRVDRAMGLLTERERMALLLRDVEDLPAEEVARHIGCSRATVRSHIANARAKFRRFFEGASL